MVKKTARFVYRLHWSPLCAEISTLASDTNTADKKGFQLCTVPM